MLALRQIPALLSSRTICRGLSASAVRFPAPMAATRSRGALFCSASAGKNNGTVKWFDVTKGYGFIAPEDGSDDLFVHQTSIVTDGFRSLRDGEPVEFVSERGDDGRLRAVQVTGPEGANPEGAPPRQQFDGGFGGGGGGGGARRGGGGGGARRGGGGGGGREDDGYGSYRY